nr:MAG TPA_asm: hypothetical protein [Bacteriophage sp.]
MSYSGFIYNNALIAKLLNCSILHFKSSFPYTFAKIIYIFK